jgi:ADP-dependent NAD(P)H-hydrate dehydratase / NAD(P)H-hydrate epimerase
MKLLATAELMRRFDQSAIERFRIPGLLLMENAGRCCADELAHATGDPAGKRVVVVCGKGNNGGDGFVIARHLHNRGARVDVLLLASPRSLTGDAATNFHMLRQLQRAAPKQLSIVRVSGKTSLQAYESAEIFVDAIFGTGFSGVPKGTERALIEWLNKRAGTVVAVDVPSGIAASSGEASGAAVRAHLTVTMGTAKIGHYVGAGRGCSGTVLVADIGIPREAMAPPVDATYLIEESDVSMLLPPRPFNAHKYTVGKVLVVAGSRSYTGAPVLAALAALKTGAGAVVLCVPESIHGFLVRKLTDVILQSCPETAGGTLGIAALPEIEKRIAWADVVILGPGLSRHEETDLLVRTLVASIPCPLVLDADGLNAISGATSILKRRKAPAILTPHTGELARLVGGESASHDRLRVEAARNSARTLGSIVVLKGAPTVTAEKGRAVVNATGNPGMATIGSGDVLSGIIAGLLGQHLHCFDAAYAGVFIHGKAGDIAAQELGERSVLATDILSHIPDALKVLAR